MAYFQLRLIGTSDCNKVRFSTLFSMPISLMCLHMQYAFQCCLSSCTQGQSFTNNLTVAVEHSVTTSCNCSFTIAISQVSCYDNMSILLLGSVSKNEIKYLLAWLNQYNYLAISMLEVDRSFCRYQIPSLDTKGLPCIEQLTNICLFFVPSWCCCRRGCTDSVLL